MPNEILLILNLIVIYGAVLIFYRLFGKAGLFAWTVFATITANIEVLLLVDAFGFEQTLGNIMFASTFAVTDILSENHSKKEAGKAVGVGIAVSLMLIIITKFWLAFTPSANDFAYEGFEIVFSNTPRVLFAGFAVYAAAQAFDVWLYHRIWEFTNRKSGDRRGFLWLRNNLATLISQLINAVLFNVLAFGGTYETTTLLSIIASTYIIYIVAALLDTPVVYIARRLKDKEKIS
ncbi:MAG: queuosine precursor transporter [Clostridia bacterium]|nr:queuosine precursor transporter [Clostridia bacterium]